MPKTSLETHIRPRLGQINYINSLPVSLPIARGMVEIEADVRMGTPQELNRGYAENSLELGAMSAFFYLETGNLQLIPQLSISSNGPVGSVLFFSKIPPERVRPFKIAVSSASATSVNLLSVLLQEEFKVTPVFTYCSSPDLTAAHIDGALVIGDYALHVDNQWSNISQRFDLGEWWSARFNLPMVFAVWAARGDWQRHNGDRCKAIAAALKNSLENGLNSAFDQVIAEAVRRSGLSVERLRRYFRTELDFSFSAAHLAGLNRYKSLCEKHGLLGPCLLERQPGRFPIS